MSVDQRDEAYSDGGTFRLFVVGEAAPPGPQKPRLLDRVRVEIRTRHYSRKTEKCYVGWIRRFILFNQKRHPAEMGEEEIGAFLSSLAVNARVSASTQNQAFSALVFLYREVLRRDLAGIENVVRARVPRRLPVACGSSNAPVCASRTPTSD